MTNPFNLNGPAFLVFYGLVLACCAMLVLLARWSIPPRSAAAGPLGMFELAYLAGGASRVVDTITVALLSAQWAKIEPDGSAFALVRPRPPLNPESPVLQGAAAQILDGVAAKLPERFNRSELRRAASRLIRGAGDRLEAAGLAPNAHALVSYRLRVLVPMGIALVIGVIKIRLGLDRNHPVGFLTILVILAGLFTVKMLMAPSRSQAGADVLSRSRKDQARAARAPRTFELPLAVALGGLALVKGTEFAALHRSASSDGSSGCGGGGCGGGGCGGCS